MDIRIRLNPNDKKEKMIIDMLDKHISSSSIIVKDILYGVAINRYQTMGMYYQQPTVQPIQNINQNNITSQIEEQVEEVEDISDLEAMIDDLDLGLDFE